MNIIKRGLDWKYRIKLGTLIFSYEYDEKLDMIVKVLICGDFKISNKYDGITFENYAYKITVWDNNKYYAWLSEGSFENKITGSKYEWKDGRPSIKSMYLLKKRLDSKNKRITMMNDILKVYQNRSSNNNYLKSEEDFYNRLI